MEGGSQTCFCLIQFLLEVDHGQALLFGPSGTDLCVYVPGHSVRTGGQAFGVSAAMAVWFVAEHRTRGAVVAKWQGRPPGRYSKLARYLDFLLDIVRAEPNITLTELVALLSDTEGVREQLSSPNRAMERTGLSYKRTDRHRT